MLTIKICCRLSGSAACNMLLHGQTGGQTDREAGELIDFTCMVSPMKGKVVVLGHARQQIHCKKNREREKKS